MSERIPTFLLQDMLEAVERILSYTTNLTYDEFVEDLKTSDAVIRNLQVLGEAAKSVPIEIREKAPEIEWVRIIRSRHIVYTITLALTFRLSGELPPFTFLR